ncbi:MAG: pyrroline-5-carboxylate reductase [Oscillospiraceae bacterium]
MNIGFIGFGNMAKAIAQGIDGKRSELNAKMLAYNPTRSKITDFDGQIEACDTPLEVAQRSDYLFLCVKPQMLAESVPQFRAGLTDETIIVSIIAGFTVEKLSALLEVNCPIVRVMPNTPLLLGKGTTAVARPQTITDKQYRFVIDVFNSIGTAYEIPGDKFDEIIPVNGSSPAFIYYMAEIVAQKAEENGLNFRDSLNMFADTLTGSAAMIKESGIAIDELIKMVCSKKGTTIAMLDRLDEQNFKGVLDSALDRCVERARELGKGE